MTVGHRSALSGAGRDNPGLRGTRCGRLCRQLATGRGNVAAGVDTRGSRRLPARLRLLSVMTMVDPKLISRFVERSPAGCDR